MKRIQRLARFKLAAVLLTVVGITLALSSLLPLVDAGGTDRERRVQIFVSEENPVAAFLVMEDAGHRVGEQFPIQIIVQYRLDTVLLNMDSFSQATFDPFERTKRPSRIHNQEVTSEIAELVYEVEVVGITPLALNEYALEPIAVGYALVGSDAQYTSLAQLRHSAAMSSDFGRGTSFIPLEHPEGVEALERTSAPHALALWAASGVFFTLFALAVIRWFVVPALGRLLGGDTAHRKYVNDAELLRASILALTNSEWRGQYASEKDALRAWGEQMTYFSQEFGLVRDPQEFWAQGVRDPHWGILLDAVSRAYSATEPDETCMQEAVDAALLVFADILHQPREGRFRRVLSAVPHRHNGKARGE